MDLQPAQGDAGLFLLPRALASWLLGFVAPWLLGSWHAGEHSTIYNSPLKLYISTVKLC